MSDVKNSLDKMISEKLSKQIDAAILDQAYQTGKVWSKAFASVTTKAFSSIHKVKPRHCYE